MDARHSPGPDEWRRIVPRPRRKPMTDEERARLLDLRRRSKRGRPLSSEDLAFAKSALARDPDGYDEIEAEMAAWLRTASVWELL